MKNTLNLFFKRSLWVVFAFSSLFMVKTEGQIARPTVWFSFDNTTSSSYGGVNSSGSSYSLTSTFQNRFSEANKVVQFTNTTGHLLTSAGKLFGFTTGNIPDNFTISCWVYVDPTDTQVRKIFFSDSDNSRFGLFHQGKEIFLRRIAGAGNVPFDYRFWAPASFDAGTGWYQVILVMGKRSTDGAKYTKLYVGKKTGRVKYDATGPRVVTTTGPLETDFGGGYAFLGQQSFMNSTTQWGFGNADSSDPVSLTNIAAARSIDDFAVWGLAFTDMQAKALYDCQKVSSANTCWAASLVESPVDLLASVTKVNAWAIGLAVYPNPTAGDLTLQITRAGAPEARIRVMDLSGRTLYTQSSAVDLDFSEIVIPDLKYKVGGNTGLYLLEVVTAQQRNVVKISVE